MRSLRRPATRPSGTEAPRRRAAGAPRTVGSRPFRPVRPATDLVPARTPCACSTSRRVDLGALALLALPLADRGETIPARHLELRGLRLVVEVGQRHTWQALANRTF